MEKNMQSDATTRFLFSACLASSFIFSASRSFRALHLLLDFAIPARFASNALSNSHFRFWLCIHSPNSSCGHELSGEEDEKRPVPPSRSFTGFQRVIYRFEQLHHSGPSIRALSLSLYFSFVFRLFKCTFALLNFPIPVSQKQKQFLKKEKKNFIGRQHVRSFFLRPGHLGQSRH